MDGPVASGLASHHVRVLEEDFGGVVPLCYDDAATFLNFSGHSRLSARNQWQYQDNEQLERRLAMCA
jgi:hypothetical protein